MAYGVPYQGSKSGIAEKIVGQLPAAKHFYDLFAGGCAITHCAMVKGAAHGILPARWEQFHANDIDFRGVTLFKDAIAGKYRDEKRWISREEFQRLKATDPYVAIVWSFGNNMTQYLYGEELEEYKRRVHEMLFAEDVQERRVKFRGVVKELTRISGNGQSLHSLHSLQSLQSLQSLESLDRLESLERLQKNMTVDIWGRVEGSRLEFHSIERLQITVGDYREVKIEPDSVIYCDIPYKGTNTGGYDGIDTEAFYDWCEAQEEPVYISEYDMPEDRFECVYAVKKSVLSSSKGDCGKTVEKLYRPKKQMLRVYPGIAYGEEEQKDDIGESV